MFSCRNVRCVGLTLGAGTLNSNIPKCMRSQTNKYQTDGFFALRLNVRLSKTFCEAGMAIDAMLAAYFTVRARGVERVCAW